MKYTIGNLKFSNKQSISDHCREIIIKNIGKDIEKDDMDFILNLFNYHPDKDKKLKNLKSIFVHNDNYDNYCFFIKYKNNTIDAISWVECIKHIPFGKEMTIEVVMPFGKYKGKTLQEINDNQYLTWIYEKSDADRGLKIKINQFLKYGYVPYNPMVKKENKKINKTS